MNLLEFYPTPQSLIDKMLDGIDFKLIETVLEPSAGTGNICDAVNQKLKSAKDIYISRDDEYRGDIDCIEIDADLRGILKGKKYRVAHDDFLMYESKKKYDLIVMNPPFSDGDRHLMKAIDLLEPYGGNIVCLTNSETIKNPYTNIRKTLVRRLNEYDAVIEYLDGEFENAERKTNVEVALIRINIPAKENSLILDHLEIAKERKHDDFIDPAAVTQSDFIQAIIEKYNFEINAGVHLIQEYTRLQPYILDRLGDEPYKKPILKLEVEHGGNDGLVNGYIKHTRLKYWNALFENKEFTRSLTYNLRSELYSIIGELSEYEFNYHNIMEMRIELNKKTVQGIEDAIIGLFDELSHKYSWYGETSQNIHYYNGWKTNTAYKINRKVVIPMKTFDDIWKKFSYRYDISSKLSDIEKCLAFLDGDISSSVSTDKALGYAEDAWISKNIECKYFKVTFYKKGTCHLTFTNEQLLDKFNIYGSQRKNWLPPCYGKKQYSDMTAEEKAVVDDFGVDYNNVIDNKEYYIVETGQSLLLEAEPAAENVNDLQFIQSDHSEDITAALTDFQESELRDETDIDEINVDIASNEMPEQPLNLFPVVSPCHSNYIGMSGYIGKDNCIYLGKSGNYRYNCDNKQCYYDNSDNSLIFVSDNPEVYYFLCGDGYGFSKEEMLKKGALTETDLAEFARVYELLSLFEKQHKFTFGGIPFVPDRKCNIYIFDSQSDDNSVHSKNPESDFEFEQFNLAI
ncbi:MAG: DUF4942 domain-containing protein [Oscillospiraceae bacterium]|nr:DUF4942 domain-containing protein [Oscillospiraceae bacterium]